MYVGEQNKYQQKIYAWSNKHYGIMSGVNKNKENSRSLWLGFWRGKHINLSQSNSLPKYKRIMV